MSFCRYGKLRSEEDVTQLDRGRVRQTRFLLSGAVSTQEETPVRPGSGVREPSCEPAAGEQRTGWKADDKVALPRPLSGDSTGPSCPVPPQQKPFCPTTARQGPLPPSPPSSSHSSPWQPSSRCEPCIHTRCVPSTPAQGTEVWLRPQMVHSRWNVGAGAAKTSPHGGSGSVGTQGGWPTSRRGSGPGSSGARNPGGHPGRQDIALDLQQA